MYGQSLRGSGLNNSAMGDLASPNTFMKLQNPEMDPETWFTHDTNPMGVADMFADLPCDRMNEACMQD
jgi:hypothetical protein